MHAVREGDYLIFITDHFSEYGIIAKDNCWLGICKAFGIYNPVEGICYDWMFIAAALIILAGGGYMVYRKRKKKQASESAEA
jgi:LPXTG-motif cell wall-anchored protein